MILSIFRLVHIERMSAQKSDERLRIARQILLLQKGRPPAVGHKIQPRRFDEHFHLVIRHGARAVLRVDFHAVIVKNDLQDSIQPGSKLSIAAACFSIYAYQELKKQLEKQISVLENKMKKEKQLNRRMEMNAEMKRLRKEIDFLK